MAAPHGVDVWPYLILGLYGSQDKSKQSDTFEGSFETEDSGTHAVHHRIKVKDEMLPLFRH